MAYEKGKPLKESWSVASLGSATEFEAKFPIFGLSDFFDFPIFLFH